MKVVTYGSSQVNSLTSVTHSLLHSIKSTSCVFFSFHQKMPASGFWSRIIDVNGPHFETQARPDIYFWSSIQARKPNLPSESRYAQLYAGYWGRSKV